MSLLTSLLTDEGGFTLQGHLEYISRERLKKRDVAYTVVGEEGTGKDTITHQIARYVATKRGLDFSVKPISPIGDGGNIVYPAQCGVCILKGQTYLQVGAPLVFTEAINTFFSRNSSRREQKDKIIFLGENRYRGLLYFFLIPGFEYEDKFIRTHRNAFIIYTWVEQFRNADGTLSDDFGHARFYEKMRKRSPFQGTTWFKDWGRFKFESLEGDALWEEYNYYKDMFTQCSNLGFEAPWRFFMWRKGAKVPSIDKLMETYKERSTEELHGEMLTPDDIPKAPDADEPPEDEWR